VQDQAHSFGYWLRRRRKALDLTQEALAQRVSCSGFSIRKIEAGERRPSRRLAERLATSLAIPEGERRDFLAAARAVRAAGRLKLDATPLDTEAHSPPHGSSVPGPAGPATGRTCDATPFVGRIAEFSAITALIARISAGAGQIVLIEGEPGIGKSRLMREVTCYADGLGVPVLATSCYEIERAVPFQPVIDLAMRALDLAPAAELRKLAPVSFAELAVLVPEVGERFPDLPKLSSDFPEARRARLARAVAQLLEAVGGGRPSIIMVDDIQWADEATAQVLHYLARRTGGWPVLVIYAFRDEDLGSDEQLARLIESLRREANANHLRLSRLTYADTESLVAAHAGARVGTQGLAERLHRETEGNPFFLTSMLQSLSDGDTQLEPRAAGRAGMLPDALRDAVRVRLAHVPKEYRPILESAAVLGRRVDFDALLDVSGASEERLLDALGALVNRRLLHEEPEDGLYDFSHDKVREVVYGDIGGARRRLLHRSVAEALERRGDADSHERDAQLAEHYERAQVWSKALRYLVLAGERSLALFAMRDALHWLDRAVALSESHPGSLTESERLEIYERRGMARAHAGETQGAVADIRRVVDAARAGGERARTRDALVQLGMAYRRADAYQNATACLTEALAECRAMNDERRAADTLYHLGTVAWSSGLNNQAIEFHQQAVEICERSGFADLVAVQAYHGRGEAYFANAEPAAAIDCFRRSLALARGIGDKGYESENLMMIGHASVGSKGVGNYPQAIANFEQALEIARAADLQWHIGPALLGLDHARACTGGYGVAWSGMRTTMGWLESLRQVRYQLIGHDLAGQLLLDLELNQLAIEELERGIALGDDTGINFWRASIEAGAAVARSRLGQKDVAQSLLGTLERTRRNSERYLTVRCLSGLAEIALAAGDTGGCREYATDLLAIAEPNGLREFEAGARCWLGEALLLEKTYAAAEVELSRAAELAEYVGRVRLQMSVQAAFARLNRAQGQSDAARRHDARVRSIADAIERSLVSSGLEAPHRIAGKLG
jgi:tetratricopeptide (TPR) repeat protein/transcriptional regulator with XRE-family HTH domain